VLGALFVLYVIRLVNVNTESLKNEIRKYVHPSG
jgi:hypothetical protein